jgi:hypothetical protein
VIPPYLEYPNLKTSGDKIITHIADLTPEMITKKLKAAFPEDYEPVWSSDMKRYIDGNDPFLALPRHFVNLIDTKDGGIYLVKYKGSNEYSLPREPVHEGETNEDALKRLKKKLGLK